MKILLAAINAKYIHSNLAVYCLKAYAGKHGKETAIAEYTINQQTDEILQDIYKQKPDMLCLSCYIWNLQQIEELIREVKKVLPNTIIWVGGPEVSYDGKSVLEKFPELSGVMKGEGEETFVQLLEYYEDGKGALSEIQGIDYRDEEGKICQNEWRKVMDLSQVPFVYEDMEKFANKIIYYESSRGCPFSCSYCLSSVDKCLRFRDIEIVKQELQYFLDNKVPQVKFVDRTFNCKHDHALAIWRYIQEHDNGITNFHFEVSADILNEEEIEVLSKMRPGLVQLEIGVQSTNPDTIKEIHRTMKFDKLAKIVTRINEFRNIHQHLDLIAGLPHEDYDSFAQSFNDVYALQPEQLQLGFLKVLKGSYMEEHKEEYGLVYKNLPPYEVLYTKWISYEDTLRLKGIEEMVEVYYNTRQFCHTLPYLMRNFAHPFAFFEALAKFYEENELHMVNHSRATRYELLLHFAKEIDAAHEEEYRQLLTLDFYLRENAKSRPAFAGESTVEKETERTFYDREEEERRYLKGYDSYEKRKLRKMTHLERFTYDVLGDMSEKECHILFDYQNRSALDHQASIFVVE